MSSRSDMAAAARRLAVGHPLLGTFLPDMQDMGFSEDTVLYRGYYGFKLTMPIYPFITIYQFMQIMQSPARAKLNELQLIRSGMRVGLISWLPIAVGSAAFYGLEFGLRPAMHSVLGLQPLQASGNVSGAQKPPHDTGASRQGLDQGLDGFQHSGNASTQQVQWTDPTHGSNTGSHTGDVAYDWRRASGVAGLDTAPDEGDDAAVPAAAPAPYYPPLVGTQIAAGTVAASAVAFNMLRTGGAGGFARFAVYCLMGGLAGSLVPSYEDSMARKYK